MKTKSSEYTGVSFSKLGKKCRAQLKTNGKIIYLGHFDNEAEASMVYKAAKKCALENKANEIKRFIRKKSSKFKGVSFNKSNNNWKCNITLSGKQIYLGSYKTQEAAYEAYNIALKNAGVSH